MLVLVLGYKASTTVRAGGFATGYGWHLVYVIKQASRIDHVSLGIGLPYVMAGVLRHHADLVMLVVGAVLGAAVFAYLYRDADQSLDNAGVWLMVLALSPVVYWVTRSSSQLRNSCFIRQASPIVSRLQRRLAWR
jgi:hypothetical protein